MNKQEKATHIGKMWQAWREDDQCIQYQDGDDVYTKVNLGAGGNHFTLADHPERFSVKKEPRFTYVNILQHPNPSRSEYSILYNSSASAVQNAACSVDTVLVTAHPIELPEAT